MLPDFIKISTDGSVKQVTSITTICDVLSKSPISKEMLNEIAKLFTFTYALDLQEIAENIAAITNGTEFLWILKLNILSLSFNVYVY